MITVDEVANGLVSQGYTELGGSDVWRYLVNEKTREYIKIFYNNYKTLDYIIVRSAS